VVSSGSLASPVAISGPIENASYSPWGICTQINYLTSVAFLALEKWEAILGQQKCGAKTPGVYKESYTVVNLHDL